jgi:hypothetical protein
MCFFAVSIPTKLVWQPYQKTTKAWLAIMDQYRQEIRELFIKVYGKKQACIW